LRAGEKHKDSRLGADHYSGLYHSSQAALSIIAPNNIVPQGLNCDRGWRTFEVGFNPPSVFGVVAAFARPLAREHISIHWISSSPTDYLMVKQANLETAIRVLSAEGHPIRR